MVLHAFGDKIQKLDVRSLEMPQPMVAILSALEQFSADNSSANNWQAGTALYVYHKRIPVFLLPELAGRGFDYRIREIQEGEVHMLIFKK